MMCLAGGSPAHTPGRVAATKRAPITAPCRLVSSLDSPKHTLLLQMAALRGDLDPKPWEENTERAPGVLLGSLITFPTDYTFQVGSCGHTCCVLGGVMV